MISRRNTTVDEGTLFISQLKDVRVVNSLVTKALRARDPHGSVKTIELIILMLRIQPNSAKATDLVTPNVPPPLLSALISSETTQSIYGLLRIRGEKKKTGSSSSLTSSATSSASLSSSSLGSLSSAILSAQHPSTPLGFHRLALIKLIRYIFGTGFAAADTAMIESRLLSRCLDLGFLYHRNSVLHSVLVELLEAILQDPRHDPVVAYLIRKYHLTKKILQVLHPEPDSEFAVSPIGATLRAFLVLVSNMLVSSHKVKRIMRKSAALGEPWTAFVDNVLTPINKSQFVDPAVKPQRDPEKSQDDAQKWLRRWEDFGFIISHQ